MSKGKSKQASRQQQQKEAAARRRAPEPRAGLALTASPLPVHRAEPMSTAPAEPGRVEPQHYYLDVAAVRIQSWLARSADLKRRRGASVLLTVATEQAVWETQLPAGTEWNDEAGDLDGVVSLRVADEVSAQEAKQVLDGAAREVVRKLRAEMPHCAFQAVTGSGTSYAGAYGQMAAARRRGMFVVDAPAPPPELVVAKPCDACRQAPAEHAGAGVDVGRDTGRRRDLCGECLRRQQYSGGTRGYRLPDDPEPERTQLLSGVPTTLAQLSKTPPQGEDVSSLRKYAVTGSTAFPAEVARRLESQLGVRMFGSYGATEYTQNVAQPPRDGEAK